jgi:hypothetical protein
MVVGSLFPFAFLPTRYIIRNMKGDPSHIGLNHITNKLHRNKLEVMNSMVTFMGKIRKTFDNP